MKRQQGFTLVELLVVIGIIALLISLLLPALTRSRQHAASTVCKSNLHQIAIEMQIYANNYKGWIFPVGNLMTSGQYANQYETLGTNKTPTNRWPMRFFKFSHPDLSLPPQNGWVGAGEDTPNPDPLHDALPWTPPILRCPADLEAAEAHSYILNKHLAKSPTELVKANSRVQGRESGNVIVMGEKVSSERDYYMEVRYDGNGVAQSTEFAAKVELFRHGRRLGSNYLFKDWHVDWVPPEEAMNAIDPWGLPDDRPN